MMARAKATAEGFAIGVACLFFATLVGMAL